MNRSTWVALILVLLVAGWLASGPLLRMPDAPPIATTQSPAEPTAPLRVGVRQLTAAPIARELVLQGQLEPLRRVEVRAETAGLVVALPVARGQPVAAGALLARLAEDDRPAQLARAEAEVASQELLVAGQRRLKTDGLQAETQLKAAQAALAAARAELARLQLDLERTRIRAPFAGILETRPVELGSLVERGDPIAELVDDATLLAVAQVPQQQIGQLALGQPARLRLLDGRTAEGQLRAIASVAAPGTRGFRIEVEIPNAERRLPAGASIELRLQLGTVAAHFLTPAALALDDAGVLGVKTVTDDQLVRFLPIERVRGQLDGLWVSGLPEQATVIVEGQGFVLPGERVEPVLMPAAAENPVATNASSR